MHLSSRLETNLLIEASIIECTEDIFTQGQLDMLAMSCNNRLLECILCRPHQK